MRRVRGMCQALPRSGRALWSFAALPGRFRPPASTSSATPASSHLQLDSVIASYLAPGDIVHAELLRSPAWIAERRADQIGAPIFLELEELGMEGWGAVVGIRKPELAIGPGRVVLTTVRHLNSDLYELFFVGHQAPLRPTGLHKLYSADRAAWVHTRDLVPGERIATEDGESIIDRIVQVPGIHIVYNLGVEGDHEFFAGAVAARAHNMDCFEQFQKVAGHVRNRFPGKSIDQITKYLDDLMNQGQVVKVQSGAKLIFRGKEILILRDGEGAYFTKDTKKSLENYVRKFIQDEGGVQLE